MMRLTSGQFSQPNITFVYQKWKKFFQVWKTWNPPAIVTGQNLNSVCSATKINAQQNGASCPSSTCNLRVMSIHFMMHQGPGPLSNPPATRSAQPNRGTKGALALRRTRTIRAPSGICLTSCARPREQLLMIIHLLGRVWRASEMSLAEQLRGTNLWFPSFDLNHDVSSRHLFLCSLRALATVNGRALPDRRRPRGFFWRAAVCGTVHQQLQVLWNQLNKEEKSNVSLSFRTSNYLPENCLSYQMRACALSQTAKWCHFTKRDSFTCNLAMWSCKQA